MAAVTEAWETWYEVLGEAVADGDNRFTLAATILASDGSVSDGPVGALATGYSVIKADSLDDAVEQAKGCPILCSGGQITVCQTFQVM